MAEQIPGRNSMIGCYLCNDPACSKACGKIDCGKLLRSIWFNNARAASLTLPAENPCIGCGAPCENACVNSGQVKITDLIADLYSVRSSNTENVFRIDESCLKTDICGIPLENPFLLSSSVVGSTYDMCARAFEAGWAGVSFKTICSFDIHEASPRFSAIKGDNGSIIGFKNIEQLSEHSVSENMAIFRELKKNYPSKFILASIMGQDEGEWESLSRSCEENGADAIELNFSCPNMAEEGLGSDIGQIPSLVEKFTAAAKRGCTIPVIAKLTPNIAAMRDAAEAALRGGADGISAINTIKSITDVNIHTYVSEPSVHGKSAFGGYSGPAVKPIALRFVAELGRNPSLNGKHISGMGGIENWSDALEFMLLGAGSCQVTTAVMKYGYRIVDDLKSGLALYMNEKGFKSINELKGSGLDYVYESTDVLERDTVIYPKFLRNRCKKCGRCYLSCRDGGHQAISLTDNGSVVLNPKKCVGCHLCVLVCPAGAIVSSMQRRDPV